MGLFGSQGLKSAFNVASLLLQDIVARSITLTQAAGLNAVKTLDGAFLNLSTADARATLSRSIANQIGVGGSFRTGVTAQGSGVGDATIHGDFYAGAGQAFSVAYTTRDLTSDGNITLNGASSAVTLPSTDSSGSPGAATINKPSGRSAIAAGASSVVISNSIVTAAARIFISPKIRDATGLLPIVSAQVAATSFTVSTTANCTAALTFDWWVIL